MTFLRSNQPIDRYDELDRNKKFQLCCGDLLLGLGISLMYLGESSHVTTTTALGLLTVCNSTMFYLQVPEIKEAQEKLISTAVDELEKYAYSSQY